MTEDNTYIIASFLFSFSGFQIHAAVVVDHEIYSQCVSVALISLQSNNPLTLVLHMCVSCLLCSIECQMTSLCLPQRYATFPYHISLIMRAVLLFPFRSNSSCILSVYTFPLSLSLSVLLCIHFSSQSVSVSLCLSFSVSPSPLSFKESIHT